MSSPFVDYVKIYFRSGAGGRGIVSFRREKHVEKGGPDGGDGGRGGDVILEGDSQLWTLLDLKYRKHIAAGSGEHGEGARRRGKTGRDEVVKVPLGTVVKNADTDEVIGEINKHGEQLTLLKGGIGGLGNWHFRSSTNQTPDRAQSGAPGEEMAVILELKVLADVGLVGFPNAGKSTLLSVLSSAKPKVANYPFTTLVPNLGIVKLPNYHTFVMADIPGIIEGAHEGKGLGIQFLRHIERNAILLLMVPADSEDPGAELKVLKKELKMYDPKLLKKKLVVAVSKSDLFAGDEQAIADFRKKVGSRAKVYFISAASGDGLPKLLDELWKNVDKSRQMGDPTEVRKIESWEN